MVNAPAIAVVAILALAFFGLGGVDRLRAFAQEAKQGTVSIFTEKTDIAGGQATVTKNVPLEEDVALGSSVASNQRKSTQGASLDIVPDTQGLVSVVKGTVFLDEPTQKQVKTLSGRGTAQFSTGEIAALTPAAREALALTEFSSVELADIQALDQRRAESKFSNLKLSGAETVLRKREQEEISKSFLTKRFGGQTFVAGKLFGNPDFFVKGIDF